MRKISTILSVACLMLVACGPVATPEVIRDFSRANTLTALARPAATPTGPTPTPTVTPTLYSRPTDPPTLDLDLPLIRVGEETITLGDFRKRVRYERFAALDEVRRTVERVGLENVNLALPGENPTADFVASVFNTLANSRGFGFQVYDILLRESIIRQEFQARGLSLEAQEVRNYWIRRFGLQLEAEREAALEAALETYLEQATRYSGMSREAIWQVAESYLMATTLRPIIAREMAASVDVLTFKVWRLVTKTRAEAETALAQIEASDGYRAFRDAACTYSIDPSARGRGGDLGYVTRGSAVPGLQNAAPLFEAEIGAVVGPLPGAGGWYVFRVNDRRRNADGDMQVRLQVLVVATEALAAALRERAAAGEDFALLACRYSLEPSGGNGGDLGYVGPGALAPEVVQAVQAGTMPGLFGPIETADGFEIILIEDRKLDIPQPAELEQAEARAFARWQDARASSNAVTVFSSAWRDAIPEDPLPRDVAPFLREEYFGLPTPAPTPTP